MSALARAVPEEAALRDRTFEGHRLIDYYIAFGNEPRCHLTCAECGQMTGAPGANYLNVWERHLDDVIPVNMKDALRAFLALRERATVGSSTELN